MNHLNVTPKKNHKDPVCDMDVSSVKNEITANWNDHIYYFCSERCREEFEKSPDKYLKQKSWLEKKWDGYLKRLNKKTDGKPQCCG